MIFDKLTLTEMKLIEKCADAMIESLTRIAGNSHPIFDEFYEAYKGDGDDNKLDIQLVLLNQIELWESIKECPADNMKNIEAFDLLILRMILSDNDLPGLGKSRRALITKIDLLVSLKPKDGDINLN